MNYRYFVGHRKPDFPIWNGFVYFELPPPSINSSLLELRLLDHRLLSEYASLFQLRRNLLGIENPDDQITIAQYRRFVINVPLGLKSSNLPWARVLSPEIMRDLPLQEELLPQTGQDYLIGSALHLPMGILGNYAGSHYTRDILRFTANLIDIGIMSNAEAFGFLNQPLLIPSPSCGSFPLKGFLEILGILEKAAEAFFENGYQAYDDRDQGRVCGALIERLNSYLLIKQLSEQQISCEQVMGSTTLVSDSLKVTRGLMSQTLKMET
jgi:hypothetical protein